MRVLGIILLFLSAGFALSGQNDFRVIGSVHRITTAISADFYIHSIEDQRVFRANLGIVNRGVRKDIKRPLILESGFFDALLEQMNGWLSAEPGAEPVVAKLRELYIWEKEGVNAALGFIRLEMAISGKEPGQEKVISVELSGKDLTVAGGHAPRLEAAFFQCLQQYNEQRNRKASGPVAAPPSVEETRPPKPGLMAAANFLNLRQGKSNSVPGTLRRKGGPYRYELSRSSASNGFPHYALIKEDKLFIWAGNYPGAGFYYTRVLEQGRYLFMIDDIYIRQDSELKEQFGQFFGKVGIVIDMDTGLPQIVNDELMAQLMAPYPELREKYLFKDILKFPFQLTRVQNVIAEINRREQGG